MFSLIFIEKCCNTQRFNVLGLGRVRVRVSIGSVTAASQDWGLRFGPVTMGRERATYGYRPQTLNPDPGERTTDDVLE